MMFESCVVLDGDKTAACIRLDHAQFESCVVLDGDKTAHVQRINGGGFESCVVLDGDKTWPSSRSMDCCLRVVLF